MKLACDACHAKYSIADERVGNKTFKFRCKKCSHVIVLRGTAAPIDTPPPDSGAWHAVVGGEQLGPFDAAELVRRREAGELDDAAFVWREGLPDWVALGTVDELRAQPSPTTAVEVAEATRLRNERNETSVLFTLGNLQKLAAEPARPAQTSSTTTPAGEEGSGLIDIRALASTWAAPTAKPSATTAIDELPVYASTGVADPIVLVPTPSRHGIDRRLLFALIAMLGIIVALGAVLVVVLTRDGGTAQAAVPTRSAIAVSVPVPVVVTQPAAPPPAPAPAVVVPTEQPAVPPAPAVRSTSRRAKQATKQPAPIAPKQDDRCTEVSCAYSDYAEPCCEAFKPRKAATSPSVPATSDLPDNLDRATFMKGIATFDAQKCGASSAAKGIVSVSMKITADGKVAGVTIKSTPDPALGACVEREARRGTFAKTKRGGSYAYVWRF